MSLEFAILGYLCEQPRTGYDLRTRCFGPSAAALWTADQAQIYRTLERLHSDGLVTATTRKGTSRPDRKVYRPTPAGRASFLDWAATPLEPPAAKEPLLVQISLGELLEDDELLSLLRAHRDVRTHRAGAIRAELESVRGGAGGRAQALRAAGLEAALAREDAAALWADGCIGWIESGALPQAAVPRSTATA